MIADVVFWQKPNLPKFVSAFIIIQEKSPGINDFRGFIVAGVDEPLARRSQPLARRSYISDLDPVADIIEITHFSFPEF